MEKDNTKRNNIVAIVTFVLIVAFGIYFVKAGEERHERESVEAIASAKEDAYNKYIEEIKDIVDSTYKSDQVKVAEISIEALYSVSENEDTYKKNKDGNEYLDKLTEEATKNLNESLHFLLTGFLEREHYEAIRIFADNPIHVSKENIALFEKKKENIDNADAEERQAKREELGAVQTGYSESEVKLILGSPQNVTKNNEAEFWTYGDVVLTMKNGYVYDITSSLE
ncbi:hypothetical protein ACIQ57_17455 [Lysinibacillus xylanilyticus]|uniref:hypothetical protein n=1 Tax=Lysinibacillus xylanilyticus TaxID=582475 RepID=UPI0038083339